MTSSPARPTAGRPRRARLAVAAVAAGTVAVTALAPTVAAASRGASPEASPANRPAGSAALPPLDPALLSAAIAGLPNATVTGALLSVRGPAGSWSGTSGVADVRTQAPVPPDGRFRIGSATKMFTAVVVLQLAAEHRVGLETPVQRYLPGLLPAAYPNITVGQLLNHTSGLPSPPGNESASDPRWFAEHRFDVRTPREIVASAVGEGAGRPMEFPPGTQQHYAGLNYTIAGMLIERVTGHTFAEEVRRRVTAPLGLRHTVQLASDDPRIPGPHAHGYVTVDGALVDVTEQSPYEGAEGGMISTSADLTRFLTALYRGRLLPPAQLEEMFTLPQVPYTGDRSNCTTGLNPGQACFSMGLSGVTLPNGVTVWGKSGARPGYTTGVFATRDARRVLVYSLNPTGNKDGSEEPYIRRIAAAAFDPDLAK